MASTTSSTPPAADCVPDAPDQPSSLLNKYDLGVPWHELDQRRFILIGSTIYLAECFAVYPLDLLKTQLQVEKGDVRLFSGLFVRSKEILVKKGLRGLYSGYWSSALGSLPSQVFYILSYNWLKDKLQTAHDRISGSHTRGNTVWIPFVSGGFADIVSNAFFVPVDVIVQRLQLVDNRYSGGIDALRTIIRNEGIRTLYRGFGATLLTYTPASAIWWCTYEFLKRFLSDYDPRERYLGYARPASLSQTGEGQPQHVQNRFAMVLAGTIAGAVTSVVINPLDVVKTRLQTQVKTPHLDIHSPLPQVSTTEHIMSSPHHHHQQIHYRNLFHGLQTMIQREGLRSLMKGVVPRVLSTAPISGLSSLIYEFVLNLSRKNNHIH